MRLMRRSMFSGGRAKRFWLATFSLSAALVSTGALSGATSAQGEGLTPSFVIQGYTNIGGFSPTRDGSLDGAIGVFGQPSSMKPAPYGQTQNFCVIRWARFGITMKTYLIAAERGLNCTPETRHWTTRLTDPRWRTAKGLRIGDPVQRLMRRYPTATRATGGWWALVSKDLLGIGESDPLLSAHVVDGRVREFDVYFPSGGI